MANHLMSLTHSAWRKGQDSFFPQIMTHVSKSFMYCLVHTSVSIKNKSSGSSCDAEHYFSWACSQELATILCPDYELCPSRVTVWITDVTDGLERWHCTHRAL